MRHQMVRFWRGELPLRPALWTFHVVYGAILHIAFTCIALVLFTIDAQAAVAVAAFLLPNIYTFAGVVGVWRSADRHASSGFWADMAKAGAVLWAAVCLII